MTGHDVTYHDGAFLAVSLVEVDHFLERKSQMTSELRTKKGSSEEVKISRANAKGPAVPSGSDSCENVSVMPN